MIGQRLGQGGDVFRGRAATAPDDACTGIVDRAGITFHQFGRAGVADLAVDKFRNAAIALGDQHTIGLAGRADSGNRGNQFTQPVAAIGAMMVLASAGQQKREGIRMGLWGAAQAIAFALGGFLGTVAVDLTRYWLDEPAISYGLVFACEGFLFLIAASLARHIHIANWGLSNEPVAPSFGDIALAEAGEGGIR